MKEFPLPVRSAADINAPGSPAGEGESFSHLPLPRDVPVFPMPRVQAVTDATTLDSARKVLRRLIGEMGSGTPKLELIALPAAVIGILDESLGEGEISIRIVEHNGEDIDIRIQETVFAGVWRERHLRGDSLLHDWLQSCPMPSVVIERARHAASTHLPVVEMPRGATNAPALLTEIREHVLHFRSGQAPHVINLTLLPLTAEDHAVLERIAPVGPVAILSRGFGNCRITSTRLRDLWRVQYFNSMQTLILNTLEVVEVPEVARAAAEDLADSRERLQELVDWLDESGAP